LECLTADGHHLDSLPEAGQELRDLDAKPRGGQFRQFGLAVGGNAAQLMTTVSAGPGLLPFPKAAIE
jgi:hypothetical protein